MNTSIVFPLGHGSHNNDLELRYCLRSVEQHLTGYGDIFIIGRKPDWLKNVIHIPFDEGFAPQSYDKERNIYNKIMAACADERVSDDFLFMNDDHFLLQDYEAGKFPYYCHGWLSEFMTVTDYKSTISNTNELLWPLGHDCLYFDVHCPIVYNKERFAYVLEADWSKPYGFCIKTVYSNCVEGLKALEQPDLKIDESYPSSRIHQLLSGRPWFSIGNRAFDGGIKRVLQELYPKKSIYE
jgi:hypothetical protein